MSSRTLSIALSDAAVRALLERAQTEGVAIQQLAATVIEESLGCSTATVPKGQPWTDALDRLIVFGKSLPPAPPDPMIGGVPRVVRWVHEGREERYQEIMLTAAGPRWLEPGGPA